MTVLTAHVQRWLRQTNKYFQGFTVISWPFHWLLHNSVSKGSVEQCFPLCWLSAGVIDCYSPTLSSRWAGSDLHLVVILLQKRHSPPQSYTYSTEATLWHFSGLQPAVPGGKWAAASVRFIVTDFKEASSSFSSAELSLVSCAVQGDHLCNLRLHC